MTTLISSSPDLRSSSFEPKSQVDAQLGLPATTDVKQTRKNKTKPTHAWGKLPSKEYQDSKKRPALSHPGHAEDKLPSKSRNKKRKRRRGGENGSHSPDNTSLIVDYSSHSTADNLDEGGGSNHNGESSHSGPSPFVVIDNPIQVNSSLRPHSPDSLLKKAHFQKPGISPEVLTLWWENIRTRTIGPIIDNKGDYANNSDAQLAKMLAFHAQDVSSSPDHIVVVHDSALDWAQQVQAGLARESPVVLYKSQAPSLVRISSESILSWTTNPHDSNTDWGVQCPKKRFNDRDGTYLPASMTSDGGPPDIHERVTLHGIIDQMSSPDVCFNALDLVALNVGPRSIAEPALKDCSASWDFASKLPGSKVSSGARNAPDAIKHAWLWYLLTMSGFITEPHVDASGWNTWIEMLEGEKMWVLMRKKGTGVKPTWLSFLDFERRVIDMSAEELASSFDMWAVVLSPGMQLIMPPHQWHSVFTATNSFCIGGHFLTYSLMAKTMIARLTERFSKGVLTNHGYASMEYTMPCMTYALLHRPATRIISRANFAALVDQTLAPEKYRLSPSPHTLIYLCPLLASGTRGFDSWMKTVYLAAVMVIDLVLEKNAHLSRVTIQEDIELIKSGHLVEGDVDLSSVTPQEFDDRMY